MYEARKHTHGGEKGGRGNQYTKVVSAQNEHLADGKQNRVAVRLAQELGVGTETIKRAEQYVDGIEAIKEVDAEFANSIISGKTSVPKKEIREIRKAKEEDVKSFVILFVYKG